MTISEIGQHAKHMPPRQFIYFSLVPALIAALAAHSTTILEVPAWTMFIGWVAFFIQPPGLKNGCISLICVWLGIAFGMAAALMAAALAPMFGSMTLALVVFSVAIVVVSLRALPLFNTIPAYFLGLITFFAAHLPPSPVTYAELTATTGIGAVAAFITFLLQRQIPKL